MSRGAFTGSTIRQTLLERCYAKLGEDPARITAEER